MRNDPTSGGWASPGAGHGADTVVRREEKTALAGRARYSTFRPGVVSLREAEALFRSLVSSISEDP